MKLLLKIVGLLLVTFLTFFLIVNYGIDVSLNDIESFLFKLQEIHPIYIASLVLFLILIDLFLSIPTITVFLFAGKVLGFSLGSFVSLIGVFILGSLAYFLGNKYGSRVIALITKDEKQINEMRSLFNRNGTLCLMICRACPMLPEISSCLAGISKMPFKTYLKWYLLGSTPFVLIINYCG